MNRNDLIQRIDAKLIDNGTITFNVPSFVKMWEGFVELAEIEFLR